MKTRLGHYLLTLWIVLTLNFLLPRLLPGDPLAALLDPDSSAYVFNSETRAALEAYYGLDRPLGEQYLHYLWSALSGDLGRSIRWNRPVGQLVRDHLPWTLLLTLTALALASLLGLWGGAAAGWWRGSRADRALVTAGLVAGNAPPYVVGMLLVILFGASLRWLPIARRPDRFT
jgi:peptide/nickel transport system permease protein